MPLVNNNLTGINQHQAWPSKNVMKQTVTNILHNGSQCYTKCHLPNLNMFNQRRRYHVPSKAGGHIPTKSHAKWRTIILHLKRGATPQQKRTGIPIKCENIVPYQRRSGTDRMLSWRTVGCHILSMAGCHAQPNTMMLHVVSYYITLPN